MRKHRTIRRLAVMLAGLSVAAAAAAGPAVAGGPVLCNGERQLCDRRLNEVVLPATHNSMSAQALGWRLPNQQVGIPDQLRLGIRGLLLDTYYAHREPNGTVVNDAIPTAQSRIYLCHVVCQIGATPLIDVLRAMRDHLRANPSNVLVVINEDYVRPKDFAKEVRRSGLRRYVYRGRPGPRWPTLRSMIRRHQQVVMLAEHEAAGVRWYHEAYTGILQETPFTFLALEQLTDPSRWAASCQPNRGARTGSLFLLNHWSPPLGPNPATSAIVNATDTLVGRATTCRDLRGVMPTIVAVDMFQSGGLFEAVRRLNAAVG
jgi:hypothetical protein